MILKFTHEEHGDWLVKISEPDSNKLDMSKEEYAKWKAADILRIDDNGGGWTYSGIEHEHSFPHER